MAILVGRAFNSSMNPRVEDEDSERMVLPQKIETGLSVGLKSWMIFHWASSFGIVARVFTMSLGILWTSVSKKTR